MKTCTDCDKSLSRNKAAVRCHPCSVRFRFPNPGQPKSSGRFCPDCNVELSTNPKATRCHSCASFARWKKADLVEKQSEALIAFWALRDFDVLSNRAKKDRIITEQGGKCLWCPCDQTWNGAPLVLQLDHINGDRANNTRENLRALCPNCHSQTPTFGSRAVTGEARERMILGAKKGAKHTHFKKLLSAASGQLA